MRAAIAALREHRPGRIVVAVPAAPTSTCQDLQSVVDETAATLGEKIVVRRVARVAGENVATYLHKVNKDLPPQVGVLVASDAKGADVATDIAMHIAAYSPTYLTREDVPADVVASERHIAEETSRNEGKPEAALPKSPKRPICMSEYAGRATNAAPTPITRPRPWLMYE